MGTRRWDGKPETAADKRFFDLRESGYKGPIDNHGYKGGVIDRHGDVQTPGRGK